MGEWSLPPKSLIQTDGCFRVLCQNTHTSEIKWQALGKWDRRNLLGSVSGHTNVVCECAHPPARLEPLHKGWGMGRAPANRKGQACSSAQRQHPSSCLFSCSQNASYSVNLPAHRKKPWDWIPLLSRCRTQPYYFLRQYYFYMQSWLDSGVLMCSNLKFLVHFVQLKNCGKIWDYGLSTEGQWHFVNPEDFRHTTLCIFKHYLIASDVQGGKVFGA